MTIKRRRKLFRRVTCWLEAIGLLIFFVSLLVIVLAVINRLIQ